jgi:catechol 2,3-dioxygenase-like lactoylglutathione lyase family enzyme
MKFRLDHVVIAVADLAKALDDYRALGFTVVVGGRHPGRTSHNALVVFADGAYLELIAWTQPDPAERWCAEHGRHGDGFMDFALVPEDTARAIAQAKARGLALAGPVDGGRVRPDGREARWQTGRQTTFDLPFLCGDLTPRALRVPEGDLRRHANGVTGIATVAVAVRDLGASVGRYRALLGDDAAGGQAVGGPAVRRGTGLRIATVKLGPTTILLMAPSGSGRSPALGEVVARLATRGEGPVGMVLRAPGARIRVLDRALAHGALAEIAP